MNKSKPNLKLNCKTPREGVYLICLAAILTVVAFFLTFRVYDILGYRTNRWVVFLCVAALWLMGFLAVNAILAGDGPRWTYPFYAAVVLLLTFAVLLFIQPCLSPMGIYFTVNMGDMERYAAGVPRAIVAAALFVVAIVCMIVSSFLRAAGRPVALPANGPKAERAEQTNISEAESTEQTGGSEEGGEQ